MSSVDNRIVSLTFDNSQFERKMSETLKSLDKLKQSLNFADGKKSMEDLQATASRFHFGGLQQGLEHVSKGFIALSTIAVTAISTITSKVMELGAQIVKSLSFDQIMGGFQEYELKLGSIQTIMSGSGESLDVVNAKLQELNTYSDKTIYSFKDMTSNIGKFTNAGVSLDQAVSSIQGVANVAAVSGANSEEASRAMYNFAQALSKGHVQLIDWKSIELANMGTAEFKQQLIDAAEAQGKLTKRGNEWVTSAGKVVSSTKGFNESLTDEWLTTEVLNKTLGDYSDATTDIGKKATAAAQDVKTFSQLMSTVKESIGSGWAQSFEILIGNFDEAKGLFTEINNGISAFVGKNADARNALLQGWKDLGGRDELIQGFRDALAGIGTIIKPIKEAFADIFPPATAQTLKNLTATFADFAKRIAISGETADKIKSIFRGLFAALEIGWTIIKNLWRVTGELISVFGNFIGQFSGGASDAGNFIVKLNDMLVAGGGIERFFDNVVGYLQAFGQWMGQAAAKVKELFPGGGIPGAEGAANVLDRVKERANDVKSIFDRLGDAVQWIGDQFKKLGQALAPVFEEIKKWVGEVKDHFAEVFKPGDFDKTVDAVNVGLLGGLLVILRKFLKNGLDLNLGGGITDSITGMFDQLTGTLKSMQTQIKAEALMKIAIAIGILTASIVVLSLIDSGALTKSLVAVGVGFGQLVGVLALLDKISSGTGAAKMSVLALGLGLIAGAVLLLSFAVKNLSGLNWSELGMGLAGVGGSLLILAAAVKLISSDTGGMIRAGIAMIAISAGLLVMSLAVRAFAGIAWDDMLHGFVGVAVGLGMIAGATQLMPGDMVSKGVGLVIISAGLLILSKAVMSFAGMDWGEMAKGFAGVGIGLLIVAGAMHLMPANLPLTAAGLLIVGIALNVIAKAVGTFADMDFGELAKGIGSIAVVLLILAVATNAMTGAIVGAAAIVVVSAALWVLAEVITSLSSLSWGDLLKGLVGIAAVLAVLGVAALLMQPVIPALLALGVALILVGAGFALFGIGAKLVAEAFIVMAEAGKKGIDVLIDVIETLIKALPGFIQALAEGIIDMFMTFVDAAPVLVNGLKVILEELLDMIIEVMPKIGEAIYALIHMIIEVIVELTPEIVAAGIFMIMSLLTGIRDNIAQITTLAIEILTAFINSLAANIHLIVGAAVNLIVSFINAITENLSLIIAAGLNLIIQFIVGIGQSANQIIGAVGWLIVTFITAIGGMALDIANAGTAVLIQFLDAISQNVTEITAHVKTLIETIFSSMLTLTTTFATGAKDFIVKLFEEIVKNTREITKGATDMMAGLLDAAADSIVNLLDKVLKVLTSFLDGLARVIRENDDKINKSAKNLVSAMIEGIVKAFGLSDMFNKLKKGVEDLLGNVWDAAMSFIGANSPSKEYMKFGGYIVDGLAKGLSNSENAENASVDLVKNVSSAFQQAVDQASLYLGDMDVAQPIITPVLDLTKVQRDAKDLSNLLIFTPIEAKLSMDQANMISHTNDSKPTEAESTTPPPPTEINFEQNIYSPTALSTNDIYRNTRSQIALAKEGLKIP